MPIFKTHFKRNFLFLLLFLLFTCFSVFAENVTIEASINGDEGFVGDPIKGTITITHNSKETIDEKSFKLAGKPLEAKFVQDVDMSAGKGNVLVSVYNFELPAQTEGEYTLDPISAKVGSKEFKSSKNRYEVYSANKKPQLMSPAAPPIPSIRASVKPPSASKNGKEIFVLEANVDSPKPFYPGQRAKFIYRIYYNRSVDLSESHFPMLQAEGFLKIGDTQVKDYQVEDITVQDLIQEVEAIQPGTYQYGPSDISGYSYELAPVNHKIYDNKLLTSEVPSIQVTVSPLPIQNQPESYTGAIGNKLEATARLISPPKVHIGDSIDLEISVKGPKNLKEMALPDLECQPGFSGFFEINPFPPETAFENGKKTFIVELRPISAFVNSIPSIELSSFNPEIADYLVWNSEPIALDMIKVPLTPAYDTNVALIEPLHKEEALEEINPQPNIPVSAIDHFELITPQENDICNSWLASPFVFFIIPLSGLALFAQIKLKARMQGMTPRKKKSLQLLEETELLDSSQREEILLLLKKSIRSFLTEKRIDSSDETNKILLLIEENLYGNKHDDTKELIKHVHGLFNRKNR